MLQSVRGRLTVAYVLLFATGTLVLASLLAWWLNGFYIDQLARALEAEARLVNQLGQLPKASQARITLIAPDGRVTAETHSDPGRMDNHAGRPEIAEALQGRTGRAVRTSPTLNVEMLYVAVPSSDGGAVRLAMPLTEVRHGQRQISTVVFAVAASVTLLATLVMVWGLRTAMRPLEGLMEAAQAMGQGDLDRRVPEGADELGRLGTALNTMAQTLSQRLKEVAENRDRLSTVLAHMASGVLLVDAMGRVVLANQAARQLTGLRLEDLGRNQVAALRHYALSSAITAALSGEEETRTELTLNEQTVDAILAPIQGRGVVVVLHDVTERRRVDQMRRDFVANVSHELKTPVTAVKGFAETLLAGALDEPETRRQFTEIILKEATRMGDLVSDLLELARLESEPEAVKPVGTDVSALARGVVERMQPRAEAHSVTLSADVAALKAKVDPVRLEQVLVNLIDNALKHTPVGGSITVRLRRDGANLLGEVEDTGTGIPAAALPRIFERFYRVDAGRARKAGGTGLGLAIVKHIIEAHGGHAWAASTLGRGTTISFTIPAQAEEA